MPILSRNVVPMGSYYFRIKEHSGKKYLYKVHSIRTDDKPYPLQKTLFVGEIEKILKVINNA